MGGGDAGVHATQLSVSASLSSRGVREDKIVKILLETTRVAAGEYGKHWNWKREEEAIRGMCRSWLEKHPRTKASPHGASEPHTSDEENLEDPRAPAFSDEMLALQFADRHKRDFRFVASWGRWLKWDGIRWAHDQTLETFDLARAICRQAATSCDNLKIALAVASAKTVAAVERLARADRDIAATVEQWDDQPWKFNTGDGDDHN